ncbi:tonsoku-like protein isoform X1 [Periplaneta americana]|uniref:tonsoku-like protein isoform X1 n=1 Tax=Periplaneta americana TaxID=6978 RepID=UPI0037E99912
MEACRTLHAEPDAHINSCLEASEATQSLQLSDLALTTQQLTPLFRALTRQHTLQHLHLAGNCMGDEGVTHVLQSVWLFVLQGPSASLFLGLTNKLANQEKL